jgi:isoleucyl-tRNA synthetase
MRSVDVNQANAFPPPFSPLASKVDFGEMDRRVIAWWRANDVFSRSLRQTVDGPSWVFFEGPPTANGKPGTHHVEARVFKDIFPRFKTMKGYSVPRKAGWDCHGLPVELAVEKELGLAGKPDIEKMGVARFNELCRESVLRHVNEFEKLTERVGYWIDLENPYRTMSPEYIDSVWWSLRKIFDDGRLFEDYRVAPYCTRCETTLSEHEVAQGYEDVVDPSVFVRFPLTKPLAGQEGVDLLVWTTTPWTLVANTAIAVHPDLTYVVAQTDRGKFVVAESLSAVLGSEVEILARVSGAEMAGVEYRRPFNLVDIPDAHFVVVASYVTAEDGTGLVHQAPAFGADDLAVCRANNLPVVNPIGKDGRFLDHISLVGGLFFKEADGVLVRELENQGLLFREQSYPHSYPHCWRCHTPLMYYAQLAWYIRTTAIRDALLRENERTNWYPSHIKHGRYGNWLNNNVDWALSRSRYWGTPLPVWRCDNAHITVVGSRAELGELSGRDMSTVDAHRPFIDQVTFDCPQCSQQAIRVPEVIDAWFDAGAMPFASLGYPYLPGSVEEFNRRYPAQYICEAIDQTRGWFYTMMAVGTLVFDRSSYENVVCLGHIMAEDGRKMSKHLGNIIEPLPLMDKHGADALRWFMACSGSPWSQRRVGSGPLEDIARKVLMTYWSTAAFFSLYASHSTWQPEFAGPVAQRDVLDRWLLSELNFLVRDVDESLENYDTARAGRLLAAFIDDLSNWYVRRSRRRFWQADHDALSTLFDCLETLTRLLAPVIPFVTEEIWQRVIRPVDAHAKESVHLASWPKVNGDLLDSVLRSQMRVARTVTELGRAARKAGAVRNRQPLSRALISVPDGIRLPESLITDIAAELNVKRLEFLDAAGELVEVKVKPNFRALGKRFGRQTQVIADAVLAADPTELVRRMRFEGQVEVFFDGGSCVLEPTDLILSEVPKSGWLVETGRDLTVALDTEITPSLAAEGVARDVIRVVQQARKDLGFDISDRVALTFSTGEYTEAAIREHQGLIASETLSEKIDFSTTVTDGFSGFVGDDAALSVKVEKY